MGSTSLVDRLFPVLVDRLFPVRDLEGPGVGLKLGPCPSFHYIDVINGETVLQGVRWGHDAT